MDLMDSQPEFSKSIWDYLDILVSDARLQKGREILAANKSQFDAVEKAYGVDRYVLAAIWAIKSNYSTQIGDRDVVRSTATLACVGRRQEYFREQFLSDSRNPGSGRYCSGTSEGLLGRCIRSDPVHADNLQALRRRL